MRADQAGENETKAFKAYCEARGTTIQYSATDRHTHNSNVENSLRAACDAFRSASSARGIPSHYWCDFLPEHAYIHNRVLHGSNDRTPYEQLYGHRPNLSSLRVWGCMGFVRVLPKNRDGSKSGLRATPARFLGTAHPDGHPNGILGWKWALHDNPQTIVVSKDCFFVEDCFAMDHLLHPSVPHTNIEHLVLPDNASNPPVSNVYGPDETADYLTLSLSRPQRHDDQGEQQPDAPHRRDLPPPNDLQDPGENNHQQRPDEPDQGEEDPGEASHQQQQDEPDQGEAEQPPRMLHQQVDLQDQGEAEQPPRMLHQQVDVQAEPQPTWQSPNRHRVFRHTSVSSPQRVIPDNPFAALHTLDPDSDDQSDFTDAPESPALATASPVPAKGSTCNIDTNNIIRGPRTRRSAALTSKRVQFGPPSVKLSAPSQVELPTPSHSGPALTFVDPPSITQQHEESLRQTHIASLACANHSSRTILSNTPDRDASAAPEYWDFTFGEDTINHFITSKFPHLAVALAARSTNINNILADDVYGPAIVEELGRYEEFEAFEIVEIPDHILPSDMIRFLWNFRIKRDPATGDTKAKARLCADGSRQSPSTYDKTASHTPNLPELKTFIKFSAHHDMEGLSSDQRSAYLHAPIDKEVYGRFPKHFPLPPHVFADTHCLRLLKGINGLKQGGYLWQEHRNKIFRSLGISQCPSSPCFFKKEYPDRVNIILTTHVDDGIHFVTKGHLPRLHALLDSIELHLKSTRGPISSFTGYSLTPVPGGFEMSQQRYLDDILAEYLEQKTFPSGLPIHKPTPWNKTLEEEFDDPSLPTSADTEFFKGRSYSRLVGLLMYLVVGTRPECTYTLNRCAQHTGNPKRIHWQMLQHLLQYLNGPPKILSITKDSLDLQVIGWGDADFGMCRSTRLSRTGIVIQIGHTTVLCKSSLQTIVADSTTAAETLALTRTAKEVLNIRLLLQWLGAPQTSPSTIYCDNAATVHNVSNGTRHRTKHLDIQYRFLQDLLQRQLISVHHIGTDKMTADIMTKGLGIVKHRLHTARLGVLDPRPAQGECESPVASH